MQDRDDHKDALIKSSCADMAPLGMRFPLDFDLSLGQMSQDETDQSSSSSMKGYSQKNYHIGDGTLYSVMIPHQAKQVAKTYRGSTPGRGRGRGRGRGPSQGVRGRKQLKFHHQALPPEYLDHYVQRLNQEAASRLAQEVTAQAARESPPQAAASSAGPHPLLTPDVLTAACQAERRHGGSTVRPETLSKVASVIAANSKYRQILPRPGPVRPRGRGRARGRGRGRGSRAIPGFIQEVHGNMNKGQEKILVEKSSYDGGSLFPTSVSAHLVKAIPGTSTLAGEGGASAASAAAFASLQAMEGRHRSRKPPKSDICHMISGRSSPPDSPKVSMLQTLLSAKREPGQRDDMDVYSRLNEYLPLYERLLAGADGEDAETLQQDEPLNLCIRDLSITDHTELSDRLSVSDEVAAVKREEGTPPSGSPEPLWGADYVFWPEAGVMVHPMMLEHHWRRQQQDAANWAADGGTSSPGHADSGSRRKKRSPVHVPPTEPSDSDVSICKFKFRGGANPSLQEKKKLSLNSDGQFRFFQNERAMSAAPPITSEAPPVASSSGVTSPERKRKRPPDPQRQLESQFRERGFLIQTAQTESAEGATYCKFRQLKKFTRYLFRSWRDYLPEGAAETTGARADTPPTVTKFES